MVITLCGSSRFKEAFDLANMHLSLLGHVVISLGCWGHTDSPQGAMFLTGDSNDNGEIKKNLDTLHYKKIDLSNEIFVINPGGYIGNSTKKEIAYAKEKGINVKYMFEVKS